MGFFDKLKNQAINSAFDATKNAVRNAGNKSVNVTFNDIPTTYEEFCALPQAAMATPFDTTAMTIVALCVYPMNKDLSLQMLNYLRGPRPMSGMDIQFIADRFRDKDYVPRSYFNGSTPANDYMPTAPYTITVFENLYSYQEQGYANLYIRSGGADSPRSVKCHQTKDGKWCLWEQFLLSDIRIPESSNPWA